MRKWFNGLSRNNRMLVRVLVCFVSAFSFWEFYAGVFIEGQGPRDQAGYLILGILTAVLYIYLELGRKKQRDDDA